MAFVDKTLTCRDCGAQFVFTASQQEFYQQKGFTNEPVRCPSCRSAKKATWGERPREMHKAVCAECGAECEVPFKPVNEKPVYCADCFSKKRANR